MKKTLLAVTVLVLLFTACKKEPPFLKPEKLLLTFQITETSNGKQILKDINFVIGDSLVVGVTGNYISRETLKASFTTSGSTVTVNGILQSSGETVNDFTNPVVYVVTAEDGSQKSYTVKLKSFTGLPIVYLTTEAPVVSKDDYVNGSMKIDGNLDFTNGLYDGKIQIRGRGNSTWYQEKKPYKIKLPSKAAILGMPADKEWALLANYFDKSLMRNDVAFELSERMGAAWTPKRRFVEVYMNGEFIGNYLLTETVKVSADRVNIKLLEAKNPADTTNAYLFEADMRLDGDQWFHTTSQSAFVMSEPEVVTVPQFNHIKNKIQSLESNILNGVDIRSETDLDSWIKWMIVNEVMRNQDATFFSSCYLYNNNNKIFMGPVWDFDISSGAYQNSINKDWYVHGSVWFQGLFNYHPYYKSRFKEIWRSMYSSIASMKNYIKITGATLEYSQKENFSRWNIMGSSSYEGQILSGSYQGEVDHLTDYLDQRIGWMNVQVNSW